ncbi:MAG: FAD-dependent oxidoreductase, partial [Acidobacteriota bacterium]
MNIGVIGSGIAGLTAAWQLTRDGHRVTICEMRDRPALLAHTAHLRLDGRERDIDSLLIWPKYHQGLVRFIDELGLNLRTRWFDSVTFFNEDDPKPYAGYRSKKVPLTKLNLLLPYGSTAIQSLGVCGFWLRKYLRAKLTHSSIGSRTTFGDYFDADTDPRYRTLLFPWVNCAIGFPYPEIMRRMPAMSIIRFEIATLAHLPRMVDEGMTEMARRLADGADLRLKHEIRSIEPSGEGVRVTGRVDDSEDFSADFDRLVLAIPPKRIPQLVADSSDEERRIWSSFQDSIANIYVHTDDRVMPHDREDWAAILYRLRRDQSAQVEFTVWTSRVGEFDTETQIFQSWNPVIMPAEDKILYRNQ